MAVITWRNVEGSNPTGILNALAGASRDISGGFSGLQQTIRGAELADKDRVDRLKAENTNSFLDALQRYSTPEALQAAQQSGEIDRLRSSYGAEIDSAATRGAADQLLAQRRQQALAGRQFDNQVAQDNAAPLLSQARALDLAGDKTGAAALRQQLDPRFQGEAAQNSFNAQKDLFGFQTAQNQEVRNQAAHEMGLKKDAASIRASDSSVAANAARTALTNFQLSEAKGDAQGNKLIGQLATAYQEATSNKKAEIDKIANQPGNNSIFALDSKGKVDISKMKGSEIEAANALLTRLGAPTLDVYTQGDTQAHAEAVRMIRQAGGSQKAIDAAMKRADLFSTAAPTSIGNDAASKERALKLTAAADTAIVEAAGGQPQTKEEFNNYLTNELPKQISYMDKDDRSAVIRAANKWANDPKNGVDVGNGVRAYPSAALIANTINSTDVPWYRTTNGTIEDRLNALTKDFTGQIDKARVVQEKKRVQQK